MGKTYNERFQDAGMSLLPLLEELGFEVLGDRTLHNTKLRCPRHDSAKNRSAKGGNAFVDPDKGVWHCQTCGVGGGMAEAIQFIEGEKGLQDRLKLLEPQAEMITDFSVNNLRREWMMLCKSHPQKAYDYAKFRGIDEAICRSESVGFADGSEPYTLKKRGVPESALINAGLMRKAKSKKVVPTFINRFVVMVGERIYGRDVRPDQKESTHLYSNGKGEVFGADEVPTGAETVFVVEAPLDKMSIKQLIRDTGEKGWYCIATLGTHGIGDAEVLASLRRINPKEVVIVPDCDPWFTKTSEKAQISAPGQRAGLEKADVFAKAGLKVRIAVLPDGADPNDLTSKLNFTGKKFRRLINDALTPLGYRIYCKSRYTDVSTEGGKQAFLNYAKAMITESNLGGEIPSVLVSLVARKAKMPEASVKAFLFDSFMEGFVLKYARICIKKGLSNEEIGARLRALVERHASVKATNATPNK